MAPFSLPIALVLAALSTLLFALAHPPWGFGGLAFVCLVPLFLALRSGGAARAAGLAWFWSAAAAWLIAGALPGSIAHFYQQPAWVGWLAGNLVFALTASVYCIAFAWVDRVLARDRTDIAPFLVAAAWVSLEFARARLFSGTTFFIGNPWGILGYTQGSGAMAQLASVTGVYGISFVLVLVNAGLATWLARAIAARRSGGPRPSRRILAWVTLPVLAVPIGGGWVLRSAPDPSSPGAGFSEVAIAQGNISVGRRWRSDYYARNLDTYLALTRRAIEQGSPATIFWPEAAMNFFLEEEPRFADAIGRSLGPGTELVAGGPARAVGAETSFRNSMFVIDAGGSVRARYDKEVLVPFSEYFPIADFDVMRRRFEGARTFSPGPAGAPPLSTNVGRVGMLVCVEAMLPEVAAARVRAGAEVLVNPSNDGWIADPAFAEHMLAIVALRAIEQRRFVVRASTSGPSAVIDPWGRVTVRTTPFSRQLLRGRVRPLANPSWYARLGDAFALGCLAITGLGVFSTARRPRSKQL